MNYYCCYCCHYHAAANEGRCTIRGCLRSRRIRCPPSPDESTDEEDDNKIFINHNDVAQ